MGNYIKDSMKKLKTLNILGRKTKVKFKNLDAEGICGKFLFHEDIIEVNSKLDKEIKDITIVHELVHATLYRAGISNTKLNEEIEEIICDQIAKTITENFRLIPK